MIPYLLGEIRTELRELAIEAERVLASVNAGYRDRNDMERHLAEIRSLVQRVARLRDILQPGRRQDDRLFAIDADYLDLEGRLKEKRNDLVRLLSRPSVMEE